MSAVCLVSGCGKSTVGSCRRCARDFCVAHRFVGPGGAAILDLCTECALTEAEARAYAGRLREESLAAIRIAAKTLFAEGFSPTDTFTWRDRVDSTWWAFGRFGHTQVAEPVREGWPVGDYPGEGRVDDGHGTSTNEVFVRPTYVDAAGVIAPREATRASMLDDELFTDQMCAQIAATMAEILTTAREQAREQARAREQEEQEQEQEQARQSPPPGQP